MADGQDSTALVTTTAKKRAILAFCKKPLLLPFGKSVYYVPEEAVVSVAKGTNRVHTAAVLNQVILTKSPPNWVNYLDPDRILLIRGMEGTSCYTTFKVMSEETHEEEQFIRHIPPTVCEKNFPKWKELIEKEIQEGKRAAPVNERQESRLKVLDWRSSDCTRAQINPENNGWEVCRDSPKSLKQVNSVAPSGKRTGQGRVRQPGANGSVDNEDVHVSTTQLGSDTVTTFKIRVGADHTTPKVVGEFLYLTCIKPTPVVEEEE